MKRTIYTLLFILLSVTTGSSKNIKDMWLSMPDTIIPYLTNNHRIELIDYWNMNVSPDVKNNLGGTTKLDTITSDYLQISVNSSTVFQMKMISINGEDSVLCLLKTYGEEYKESTLDIYNQEWKKLNTFDFNNKNWANTYLTKPDTMSNERFNEIKLYADPVMIYAELSPTNDSIKTSISVPLLRKEELKALKEESHEVNYPISSVFRDHSL